MKTKLETINDELYLVYTNSQGELIQNKVLKGWESWSGWYWFATELNCHGEDGYHFGYVQGSYPEWGYFTEGELNSIKLVWPIKDIDLPYAGRRND